MILPILHTEDNFTLFSFNYEFILCTMFKQSVADCLFVPEWQGYVNRRDALGEYINSYKKTFSFEAYELYEPQDLLM